MIAICDGTRAMALPAARDHKRLLRRRPGPEHGRHGRLLAAARPRRGHGRARARRRSTGRSWPRWPAAGRRSAASSTRASCSPPTAPRSSSATSAWATPRRRSILPRIAGSLGPLLLAAATRRGCPTTRRRASPSCPAPPSASCSPPKGYPGDPRRGDPIAGLDDGGGAGRARVPRRDGRPAAGRLRDERRPGADGRRPRADARDARATPPSERPTRSTWDGLQRRHDIAARPAAIPPGWAHDPALHAARDGRAVVRAGPLRADARGRARRLPRPGPPRPGPGGRARGDRGRGPRRRRSGSPRSRRPRTTTSSRS